MKYKDIAKRVKVLLLAESAGLQIQIYEDDKIKNIYFGDEPIEVVVKNINNYIIASSGVKEIEEDDCNCEDTKEYKPYKTVYARFLGKHVYCIEDGNTYVITGINPNDETLQIDSLWYGLDDAFDSLLWIDKEPFGEFVND